MSEHHSSIVAAIVAFAESVQAQRDPNEIDYEVVLPQQAREDTAWEAVGIVCDVLGCDQVTKEPIRVEYGKHKVICPVCWHRHELQCKLASTEPMHDDNSLMRWHLNGTHANKWVCSCGFVATAQQTAILLDGILTSVHEPDSSELDASGFHLDAKRALAGNNDVDYEVKTDPAALGKW